MIDRTDETDQADGIDETDLLDRTVAMDQADRIVEMDKTDRTDLVDKTDRADQVDKTGKADCWVDSIDETAGKMDVRKLEEDLGNVALYLFQRKETSILAFRVSETRF